MIELEYPRRWFLFLPICMAVARAKAVCLFTLAVAAPRPQLIVSDGGDWTDRMPEHDLLYLQKMYSWYGKKGFIENVHLPLEKHDFGINKRTAVYEFMAKHLGLNLKAIQDLSGKIDESKITIEKESALYVFGEHGENLPADAIKGFSNLEKVFKQAGRSARLR